jgi:hypothetical protein
VANAAQPSTPAAVPATVPAITNVVLSAKERADEIDRLQDWSMNDDAESLNHIVADLTSPDKESVRPRLKPPNSSVRQCGCHSVPESRRRQHGEH